MSFTLQTPLKKHRQLPVFFYPSDDQLAGSISCKERRPNKYSIPNNGAEYKTVASKVL